MAHTRKKKTKRKAARDREIARALKDALAKRATLDREVADIVNPPHRPTKLTPEVRDTILRVLVKCVTIEDAAHVAGIDTGTLYRWRQRGKKEKSGPFREFCDALERAITKRRINREMNLVAEGEKGDWNATWRMMTATEPERYAPKLRIHVTNELTAGLKRIEAAFADSPDIYDRILDALVGGDRSPGEGEEDIETTGPDDSGGEAVQPTQAEPKAGDIPSD